MNDKVVEMFIPMVMGVSFFTLIGWIVFVFSERRAVAPIDRMHWVEATICVSLHRMITHD